MSAARKRALGLGLGLLLCMGLARYVLWRGSGGVIGCAVPLAALASFLDALRPAPSRAARSCGGGGAAATRVASASSGEGARPDAPRHWELPPCWRGVAAVTYSAPAATLRRCGVAPQARRSGVPHMPLRLRGGADPSVCALFCAHVHPTRANTLFFPTRPHARSAQPSAPDCPARPSESDYQATLYVTAGVCASARRIPGPVPAESSRVPGPHTP
jgi:hypothetical protein